MKTVAAILLIVGCIIFVFLACVLLFVAILALLGLEDEVHDWIAERWNRRKGDKHGEA